MFHHQALTGSAKVTATHNASLMLHQWGTTHRSFIKLQKNDKKKTCCQLLSQWMIKMKSLLCPILSFWL